MPRKSMPLGDYEVGYGRPPAQTRFKPGQSGNPKGRTKGARDVKTLMEEALRAEFLETITVVEGGKPKRMTKLQVIVKTHANKAAKGELRALRELVALAHRLGLFEEALPQAAEVEAALPLSADDQAIVDRFLARERAYEAAANANGDTEPLPDLSPAATREDDAA